MYTQLHLDAKNKVAPCCFYNTRGQAQDLDADRALMEQGQWPENCSYCQHSESQRFRSPRIDYSSRAKQNGWVDHDTTLHTLSLFLGNKCNLHCATCDAKYSTGWIKLAPMFGVEQSAHVGFDTMRLDHLKPQMTNLRELTIMGGEPFYQDDLIKVIDYMSDLDLSKCMLRLTTNGVTRIPEQLISRLDLFGEVDVTMSIDGTAQQYEYLRHPAKWIDLIDNLTRLKVTTQVSQLRMNSTMSMANCWDVGELAAWGVRTFGTSMEFNMAKKAPWQLNNLPDPLKQAWLDRYGDQKWAKSMASHMLADPSDADGWDQFKEFISKWDQKWELDFAATFPEWTAVIKEHDLW
jgi:hypothetical protein